MNPAKVPSYWEYIRVEDLLSLQSGLGTDSSELSNDEVRFITIHQIDELWMMLALRELTAARDLFKRNPVPETSLSAANAGLRRVALIFQLAAQHFQLMETMRTQDYLKFRDKLSPASGFQSAQFREIEILMGLGEDERIKFGKEESYRDAMKGKTGSSPALDRVQRRLADTPTLKEVVYDWLARTPIQKSTPDKPDHDEVVDQYVDDFLGCHKQTTDTLIETALKSQALTADDEQRLRKRYGESIESARDHLTAKGYEDPAERTRRKRIRAAILFIDSNRQLPMLSWPCEIIDTLIELEQRLVIFRQRHARMVERVIGRRVGTGGSDGVAYLDDTALEYRIFKEIWAARTLLLQPEIAPPVNDPGFYGLHADPDGN